MSGSLRKKIDNNHHLSLIKRTFADGSGMVVELCRACLSDPARPLTWGYNKQILYSDTELDASLLVHGPPGLTAYHVAKVDSEYKLVGTDGTAKWPILCQDNDLNLDL